MKDPIESVTRIHQSLWQRRQTVSHATSLAIRITREWQQEVVSSNEHILAEHPVSGLNEKFDLYDSKAGIAYELKVSQNNTHMEFYRDLFKVIIHNESAQTKISKLIFIAPADGIARLRSGLGAVATGLSQKLGFAIELKGIEPASGEK